jgi:hypothetical protein
METIEIETCFCIGRKPMLKLNFRIVRILKKKRIAFVGDESHCWNCFFEIKEKQWIWFVSKMSKSECWYCFCSVKE